MAFTGIVLPILEWRALLGSASSCAGYAEEGRGFESLLRHFFPFLRRTTIYCDSARSLAAGLTQMERSSGASPSLDHLHLFGKVMPAGFEPHMQKLVGSKPNWRGRCVASSLISSTPTEYSKIIPSGPLK